MHKTIASLVTVAVGMHLAPILSAQVIQMPRGSVKVNIVFAFDGAPLKGMVTAVRIPDGSPITVDGDTLRDVPYGAYSIHVRARGYSAVDRVIAVDAPWNERTIGLSLSAPFRKRRVITITGRLRKRHDHQRASIQFVAIHSDNRYLAQVDANWSFRLDLEPGLYAIIVADGTKVNCHIKSINYSEDEILLETP